jgi:hypothetical protein
MARGILTGTWRSQGAFAAGDPAARAAAPLAALYTLDAIGL